MQRRRFIDERILDKIANALSSDEVLFEKLKGASLDERFDLLKTIVPELTREEFDAFREESKELSEEDAAVASGGFKGIEPARAGMCLM